MRTPRKKKRPAQSGTGERGADTDVAAADRITLSHKATGNNEPDSGDSGGAGSQQTAGLHAADLAVGVESRPEDGTGAARSSGDSGGAGGGLTAEQRQQGEAANRRLTQLRRERGSPEDGNPPTYKTGSGPELDRIKTGSRPEQDPYSKEYEGGGPRAQQELRLHRLVFSGKVG